MAGSEPRVTGNGVYDFALRVQMYTGPTDGTMTITNAWGTWSGSCSGADWKVDPAWWSVALSCWLTGSDAYAGQVLYLQMLGGPDVPMRVDGIVYAGAAPAGGEGS